MNYTKLQNALLQRVGFSDPFNTVDYQKLAPDLLVSQSGLTVKGESELLTVENIADCLTDFESINFPSYSASATYAAGDKVIFTVGGHDFVWVSLQNGNTNNTPGAFPAWWESALSAELREIRKQSVNNFVAELIAENNVTRYVKTLFESKRVTGNISQSLIRQGLPGDRFICRRIYLPDCKNIRLEIKEVGFKRTGDAQTLNFYLFHTSQYDALEVIPVTITADDDMRFVWKPLNITLDNYSDRADNGGFFLFGYYESDLTASNGQFYKMDGIPWFWWNYYNSARICHFQTSYIESQYLDADKSLTPQVTEHFENIQPDQYSSFNLSYSLVAAPEAMICDNVAQFDKALQLHLAISLLSRMIQSAEVGRNNFTADRIASMKTILNGSKEVNRTESGGEEMYNQGLRRKYELHKKQCLINFDMLDSVIFANNSVPYSGAV